MKKLTKIAGVALCSIFLLSCGSSKPAYSVKGEKEVLVPCAGVEYLTNADFFRASAMAVANDIDLAKRKALISVRAKLAGTIRATVKSTTDDYYLSYQNAQQEEGKRRIEELTTTIVDQQISGARIICDKTTLADDGKYRAYIALEVSTNDMMELIASKLSTSDKEKIDFDYKRFKKTLQKRSSKK